MEVVDMKNHGKIIVMSGETGSELCESIGSHLMIEGQSAMIKVFSNGEMKPKLLESVRDEDVFIIAPTTTERSIYEAKLLASAAWGSSAGRITLVITHLAYSRQDRKDEARTAITSVEVVRDLCQNIDRVLLLDLHAEAEMGFFEILRVRADHLYASYVLAPHIAEEIIQGRNDEFFFATPDAGAVPKGKAYSEWFRGKLIPCIKFRPAANVVDDEIVVFGNPAGKNGIIIDDMADTCGTVCKVAKALRDEGAKDIYAVATHPVLSGDAIENLRQSCIKELVVTNSIPIPPEVLRIRGIKIRVIPLDEMLAKAIKNINEGGSLEIGRAHV